MSTKTSNRPQSEYLPAFAVTFEVTLVAKDHAAAMEWAADLLEHISDIGDTLSGSAHVAEEPVEFFDA